MNLQNERLKLYVQAERAILAGQSYTIGNRTMTRANLSEVRAAIDSLLAAGAAVPGEEGRQARPRRTKRVLFRDF